MINEKNFSFFVTKYQNLRGRRLLRREAILILREIFNCCQDASLVNFAFLRRVNKNGDSEAEDFELHLKARLSASTRDIIESIANKHKLLTMYSEDYVIIYSPEQSSLQITA